MPDRTDMPQTETRRAWHALDRAGVEAVLGTGPYGLSRAEADARLARHGPNRLEEVPPPSNLAILLHQFRSPLIYILLLAALVTVVLGEYIDTGVIASTLVINATIGFTQERRAEQAVRALMKLAAPRARVIREGRDWEVESTDLVPGDLVLLESGVRVAADLRLVSATALAVDESLLTGESVPVAKQAGVLDPDAVLADRRNMVYMGTVVTAGRGRGYVVATGPGTELGAIAEHIRGEPDVEVPLQRRMDRFARVIGATVAISSLLAFGIGIALGEDPGHMFMVAAALAVSAVPEGLPVVFTVVLAIGVRRMARRNAIIRRLPAIETLGSTSVIGSDKTGTLTENRMTVQEVWAGGRTFIIVGDGRAEPGGALEAGRPAPVPEHHPLYLTLLTGVLTNEAEIYLTEDGYESQGDPTEAALLIAAARMGIEPEEARAAYPLYAEIPFEPERRYSAAVRERDGAYYAFVKGAPERLLAMSSRMLTDDGPVPLDARAIQEAAARLAARGLRVLGMAYCRLPGAPAGPEAVEEPNDLTFLGLQGMLDPPRAGVREAIAGCWEAGIRVIMITGDHAVTARAIGAELGIAGNDAPVLTGTQLDALSDEDLRRQVEEVAIYARVAPEHKLRVVQALQDHGEVVAVTGDGVNDAPALKAADIGIAMGRSGTDVAREASDMVLADDNFVSIYAAVEEGRVAFDNLRKVTFLLVSTGAAAIVALLAAVTLGWPIPLLPSQLIWLNVVTNGLQDIALAFEPGEPGVRRRPPRSKQEGILSPLLWERTLVAALVMAAGTLFLFRWELDQTGSLELAQTVALTTMVLFQNFHIGNARSEHRSVFRLSPVSNPFLLVSVAAALLMHAAALYLPPTQFILRLEPVELEAWVRMVLVAATIVAAMELHKWVRGGPAAR
jgi:Ca2+-transporting ATPase